MQEHPLSVNYNSEKLIIQMYDNWEMIKLRVLIERIYEHLNLPG